MSDSTGRILVVGSLNMDLVVSVQRHPEPGDTVLGGDLQTFPGGKGANQAVAAAKAGGDTAMLGLVGSDTYGSTLLESLAKAGVDAKAIEQTSGPSGVALIAVDEGGENTIIVSPGANGKLTPERLSEVSLDNLFSGVALVLMQLEIPLESVQRIAAEAHKRDIPVMLNAAPIQDLPDALIANLSYLVLNEGEAAFLSDIDVSDDASAREAARVLRARGIDAVIVTLGARGVVWSGDDEAHLSAHQVEVVDTTAAGDAFCGALAARLANGYTLGDALRFANAAGALAASKEGAQPSLPSRGEIEGALER